MKDYDKFLKAKELIKKNENNEALKILEKLYMEQSNDKFVAGEYAKMLLKFNDTKDRGEKILLGLYNSGQSEFFCLRVLGGFKERERSYDEARKYYNMLLEYGNYGKFIGLAALGKLEKSLGNYNKALEYLNKLLDILKNEKEKLDGLLGILDSDSEDYNNIMKKLRVNFNNTMSTYVLLGDIYFGLGDYNCSYEFYNKVIENNGKEAQYAMFKIGKIELKRRMFSKARECFVSVLDKETRIQKSVLLELAKLEAELGNIDQARSYLASLIELESNDRLYALQELGGLESSILNYDKALEYYNIVLNEGGEVDKFYALLAIAKLEVKRKNYDEAKNYLEYIIGYCSFVSFDDKNRRVLLSGKNMAMLELGKLEMILGNYDEARNIFTKLCDSGLINDKSLALNNLIYVDIHEEKYEDAYAKLDELVRMNIRIGKKEVRQLNLFLKNKLGLICNEEFTRLSYFDKQLLDYNLCATKNHIKNYVSTLNNSGEYSFLREDIDLSNLLSYIESRIYDNKPDDVSFMDKYLVDVGYVVGQLDSKDVSALEVVTLPNDKNILSIHPVVYNVSDYDINSYKLKKNVRI